VQPYSPHQTRVDGIILERIEQMKAEDKFRIQRTRSNSENKIKFKRGSRSTGPDLAKPIESGKAKNTA
jgi:hypothetical protein